MERALTPVAMGGRARGAWWLLWMLFLTCTATVTGLALGSARSLLSGAPVLARDYVPPICALLVLGAVLAVFFGVERRTKPRTFRQEMGVYADSLAGALIVTLLPGPWLVLAGFLVYAVATVSVRIAAAHRRSRITYGAGRR